MSKATEHAKEACAIGTFCRQGTREHARLPSRRPCKSVSRMHEWTNSVKTRTALGNYSTRKCCEQYSHYTQWAISLLHLNESLSWRSFSSTDVAAAKEKAAPQSWIKSLLVRHTTMKSQGLRRNWSKIWKRPTGMLLWGKLDVYDIEVDSSDPINAALDASKQEDWKNQCGSSHGLGSCRTTEGIQVSSQTSDSV